MVKVDRHLHYNASINRAEKQQAARFRRTFCCIRGSNHVSAGSNSDAANLKAAADVFQLRGRGIAYRPGADWNVHELRGTAVGWRHAHEEIANTVVRLRTREAAEYMRFEVL